MGLFQGEAWVDSARVLFWRKNCNTVKFQLLAN